jgi:hypothetical protein
MEPQQPVDSIELQIESDPDNSGHQWLIEQGR